MILSTDSPYFTDFLRSGKIGRPPRKTGKMECLPENLAMHSLDRSRTWEKREAILGKTAARRVGGAICGKNFEKDPKASSDKSPRIHFWHSPPCLLMFDPLVFKEERETWPVPVTLPARAHPCSTKQAFINPLRSRRPSSRIRKRVSSQGQCQDPPV